ncbi:MULTISPECIES: LysM peptidoglycan-binding domain-containing protein [Anaerolinea]|uniref:muramidase family protein n=1 Tax=Anaerolinea TaxID=233189 RepID=UPI00262115C5|nr:LysM peptidoglycan-binding domain-containing protein [Anaerolinea thermophila]
MIRKDSPQSVIESYRRKQQMGPFIVWGLAVVLVVVGIIILVVWFTGQNRPAISLFASPTPTATQTLTPTPVTPTSTPTMTPTETLTPTITETPTPQGPFEYTVQEGDTCWDIAVKFEADLLVLLTLNNFGNTCPIKPGDKILVPLKGQELPTETPLPTDLPRGQKIEYIVKTGETLDLIARRFNSTVEAILKENKLTDANKISAGQKLIIPVNIVTPTPTRAPTRTPTAGGPTATPVPPTATATP